MHTIGNSGKGHYWGQEAHPYIKRVVDHLPAGRLLMAGETTGSNAAYAADAGWKVHAVGFKPEDRENTLSSAREKGVKVDFSLFEAGVPLCKGEQFDAIVLLFVHLPQDLRRAFHHTISDLLKPDGGNLYLLAYSQQQPATTARLPELRYQEADLLQDFKNLEIDLLQEEVEKLPDSDQKVNLIHLSAVRNNQPAGGDTVSFKL